MQALRDPWLVAAWPGMGLVAQIAAGWLVAELGAEETAELPGDEHFDLARVEVRDGLLQPLRLPRTVLHAWRDPRGRRDLLVLLGERQPSANLRGFCERAILAARELGAVRAFTFAAMASPAPPKAPARVVGAATDAKLLAELRAAGIGPMAGGEIGGLNGVFLAAAAAQGLSGACLLGEFPYFASAVPNPKASAAVLRAFAKLSGLSFDLAELDRQAAQVEAQLSALYDQMQTAARQMGEAAAAQRREAEAGEPPPDWPTPPRPEAEPALSPADAAHLESLFAEAAADRARAFELKAELDRLGVYERYEDRFLDLFRTAD